MKTQPQITFHNIDTSPKLSALVEEKIAKLEHLSDRITACRVTLSRAQGSGHKNRPFEVGIELDLPGNVIVVNHKHDKHADHDNPNVAIRDSFNAAQRQLRHHLRKISDVH
ncbi:MAG: HPF/RaiA family ribosome-associated protein [Maritimibacter sp.]